MKQEIPWNRFAVEAIVIVGSILLAFVIDAWWNERSERQLENRYLQSLAVEVEGAFNEIQGDLNGLEYRGELLNSFLNNENMSADEFREMIRTSSSMSNISPPTAVMDELVASGQLQLLSSERIRRGIVGFRQMMDKNQENEDMHKNFVYNRYVPFLSQEMPLAGFIADQPTSPRFRSASASELEELKSNERFQNMVLERYRALERVLPRIRSTLSLLTQLMDDIDRAINT
jgi:hypothetical protein